MSLNVTPDPVLPEVLHLRPVRHGDARGWFSETFNAAAFRAAGVTAVRGLHYQSPPHAQGKLLRCVRGRLLDVVVDIRAGSPRFGQHTAFELDETGGAQVYVPEGFAHGFCTLVPGTEVIYKVTRYYAPEHDFGIAFDDPALGINWPFPPEALTLSARDRKHPALAAAPKHFSFEGAGA
ncbi:MAG: dTDP-4-dehydrorhamnose 3,5-epimerase [Hyphomonas sp.]|nr:dTDP-4-dehydrorhamnose 3,5-epimerase [Hyphomonas sp.]